MVAGESSTITWPSAALGVWDRNPPGKVSGFPVERDAARKAFLL